MLFSRDFLLADLTFKFLINFEVVFVHDKKSYASTELGYAGSEEGKILRLRIILICIL